MTERSGEARRNTGAECTNARVPAFVLEGGARLPPWVFDGEALADQVRRLKFERPREIADLSHEVRTAGGTVARTVRTGGGVTLAASIWRKVKTDWEAWSKRPLGEEDIVLDGTVVRLDKKATSISLLVVLGIRRDGQKVLLAVKNMGGQSEAAWRALLDDLIASGRPNS